MQKFTTFVNDTREFLCVLLEILEMITSHQKLNYFLSFTSFRTNRS